MKLLAELETPDGSALSCVLRTDGRLVLAIEGPDDAIGALLTPEQAVQLGLALLCATPEELPRQASRIDRHTAQVLAASLLVPTVADGLLDLATQGAEPQ